MNESYILYVGIGCLFNGLLAVPFLFSLRALADAGEHRLFTWNYITVGTASVGFWASGIGLIYNIWWWYIPLVIALICANSVWVIGAWAHFKIAKALREAQG